MVTILSGCVFMALLCAALLVSGFASKDVPVYQSKGETIQAERGTLASHRKELVFEQVSDMLGTTGEKSATLEELLPLLSDSESGDVNGTEFFCRYVQ